jgi:prepilin-type processing-associated H-X9-DG protein
MLSRWGWLDSYCPTAASHPAMPFTGTPAQNFSSNYSPTTTSSTGAVADYVWFRKTSTLETTPSPRRLDDIKGELLVGEQLFYRSANAGTTSTNFAYGSIYEWITSEPLHSYKAGGNVHNNGSSGNWLFTDGHVSFYRFTPQLVYSGSDYFMGL